MNADEKFSKSQISVEQKIMCDARGFIRNTSAMECTIAATRIKNTVHLEYLKNITVQYFVPNASTKVQSMDQGVIKSF